MNGDLKTDPLDLQLKTKKNSKKNKDVEDIINTLKQVQADFENYKKRTEKQQEDFRTYASKEILKEILPLLDSFELALKHTDKLEDFLKGMELIYVQFKDILKSQGVERIKAEKFDPHLHEALLQEESDKEEGTILEELQAGYKMKDQVLRHTKVKVAKK